jgi:hypothetical protein
MFRINSGLSVYADLLSMLSERSRQELNVVLMSPNTDIRVLIMFSQRQETS